MQDSKTVIMIVPKLPPAIDGIGDYGMNLARQIYQNYGWKTHFIVGTPDWQGELEGSFFRVKTVATRSPEALLRILPAPSHTVLLHYAGHGYANRGCPMWLVNALSQWCQAGGRLVTMFHELYATRPIFSSAILTSPLQKHIATRLIKLSDRALTSRTQYAEKIRHLSKHQHSTIPLLPVFSTVGELDQPLPLIERSRQLIVFGGRATRSRTYQQSRRSLIKICRELAIEEIIDIGPELEIEPIEGITLKVLGVQPVIEISRYLSTAIAGYLDYPTAYLGKSTIFAAYCSHGMIAISGSTSASNEDGLERKKHYWSANSNQFLEIKQAQSIATAAHVWYRSHDLKAQSAVFAASLSLE